MSAHLDWPFFDAKHRELAQSLDAWCTEHLHVDHDGDVDAQCRSLVAQLGAAGWLHHAVAGEGQAIDTRAICLIRETLAKHDGLADFAFAMQGLGSGAISLQGTPAQRERYLPRVAGHYARDILWANAGLGPEDVDITGSYDAFTFTTMLQLEDYGFCKKGEGGAYVSDGSIRLGGRRPNNTSGGHLCEGYTHGISMVIENVRQLRHDVDDSCPVGPDGKRIHTYDYREGGCRQVRNIEVTANLGWANPMTGSAMVMRRG